MSAEGPPTADGQANVANTVSRKKRPAPPLRSSPLFAPGVALWFAALFGLGTLAASTTVLEMAVRALHVDAVIPAAAPPLGMTARVLIAGGMTVLGAAIGFIVSQILAAPVRRRQAAQAAAAAAPVAAGTGFEPEMPAFRARDLHPDAPIRAPVAATDELGEPLLDDPVPAPTPALAPAPLSQLVAMPDEVIAAEPEIQAEPPIDDAPEIEAHLSNFAELVAPEKAAVAEPESVAPAVAPTVAEVLPALPPLSTAAQRIADTDLEALSNIELVERLAIAMQRHAALDAADEEAPLAFPAHADRVVAPLTPGLRTLAERRPEDTEKALRDALATLQRMSGAA